MTLNVLWEYDCRDEVRVERTNRKNGNGERIGKSPWARL